MVQAASIQASVVKSSGATVTVGCKVQNGLRMRIGEFEEETKIIGGATRTYKIWRPFAKTYVAKGPRRLMEVDTLPPPTVNGYVLTSGIPADFMDIFMRDNAEADYVKNRMLIVISRQGEEEVQAATREGRDLRTGMEPLAQNDDTRVPRKVSKRLDDD